MKWWLACIKKYVTFEGRARRREYWMFVLFNAIFCLAAMVLDRLFFGPSFPGTPASAGAMQPRYLTMLYGLFVFLPSLAVVVRRLHDIGRSGWWLAGYYGLEIVCVLLIAIGAVLAISGKSLGAVFTIAGVLAIFVASVWMLVWMCRNSQPGNNKYGPSPKEIAASPEPAAAPREGSDSNAPKAE